MDFEWDDYKAAVNLQKHDHAMKTKKQTSTGEDLREEYSDGELQNGVREKYLKQYQAGTNIVRLAPDVVAAFPTEQAVTKHFAP